MRIAFLHTADVHVQTFDDLIEELAPFAELVHVVRPDLLDRARIQGLKAVAKDTTTLLTDLADADAVICTCSTLGPIADALSGTIEHVQRIDRPVMEEAARLGQHVLIAVCLDSTKDASVALFKECAGSTVAPYVCVIPQAWPFFERGEQTAFADTIAAAIIAEQAHLPKLDCIVLAQASMRVAEPALADVGVPVISSPRLATLRAIKVANAHKTIDTTNHTASVCVQVQQSRRLQTKDEDR